jgi:hypothetical protein
MKTSMVFIALAAVLIPAAANAARQPRSVLYSYAGQLIAAPGTNTVELSVANGNRRALRSLLGQSDQQTFTFDSRFLKWNAGVRRSSSPRRSQQVIGYEWTCAKTPAPPFRRSRRPLPASLVITGRCRSDPTSRFTSSEEI